MGGRRLQQHVHAVLAPLQPRAAARAERVERDRHHLRAEVRLEPASTRRATESLSRDAGRRRAASGERHLLGGDVHLRRRADRVLHHQEQLRRQLEHVARAQHHVAAPPRLALRTEAGQ